ncbi:MAG: MutS-related protein [Oscillospiraceae bacterium]
MINPELCDLLEQKGRSFVPVSIRLEQGATVITGANMGGKSVVMKTVALNVLLLQAGFLVCAKKARMPLFYSVKMLFDDLQSIQSGLSGFGSEIVQFQKALEEVEQGYSLFLLDEFARGTNPYEGAVIVQAVTKYLNEVKAISLLTTHYDKVAENARLHYQIIGRRDVDPEQIRQELAATGDDGIQVIARHMNYGLYLVEGKSDCPQRRPEHLPDAVAEAGDPGEDRAGVLRCRRLSAVVGRCCVRRLWGGMRRRRAEKWKECPIKAGGGDTLPLSLYSWDIALCITHRKRCRNFISCTKNLCLFCHNATLTKPRRRRYNEDRRSSYRNQ